MHLMSGLNKPEEQSLFAYSFSRYERVRGLESSTTAERKGVLKETNTGRFILYIFTDHEFWGWLSHEPPEDIKLLSALPCWMSWMSSFVNKARSSSVQVYDWSVVLRRWVASICCSCSSSHHSSAFFNAPMTTSRMFDFFSISNMINQATSSPLHDHDALRLHVVQGFKRSSDSDKIVVMSTPSTVFSELELLPLSFRSQNLRPRETR